LSLLLQFDGTTFVVSRMASKFHLFWASGSPPAWRVMLTLEEKGLAGYSNTLVHFDKNEHKSEDVLKWNPRGQVPTLVYENSYSINESLAACDFIEKIYHNQGTQLVPVDDPKLHALMLQRRFEWLNMEKKGSELVYYKLFKRSAPDGVIDPAVGKKLLDAFYEELQFWEKHATEGDYLAGSKLSLADVTIFPNLAFYVRCGLDLSAHAPHLQQYYQRMLQLPSVQSTWPPHWKENPTGPTGVFE